MVMGNDISSYCGCYGQYVVNNLEKNIGVKKTKFVQCIDCEEWIEVDIKDNKTCRCQKCQCKETKRIKREYWHKQKKLELTNQP